MIWLRTTPHSYAGPRPSQQPLAFHRRLPGYAPTPLVDLPAAGAQLGVGRVLVKDESQRFDLRAFKFLGASWACERALATRPEITTLVTATDGNHGRGVARAARLRGLHARVYLPPARDVIAQRIEAEGAELIPVAGRYDDAVAAASADAAADPTALLVQDTAWSGYEEIPALIVEGYETLFAELDEQLGGLPDLLAVPSGVGSLAQAAAAHLGPASTRLLNVEPVTAACILASLGTGAPVSVETPGTIMNGLDCGTVSALAWPVLRDRLDAAVAVSDPACESAIAALAAGGVAAGPSGAAAYAGLVATLGDPTVRHALDITEESVVVAVVTEGPLT